MTATPNHVLQRNRPSGYMVNLPVHCFILALASLASLSGLLRVLVGMQKFRITFLFFSLFIYGCGTSAVDFPDMISKKDYNGAACLLVQKYGLIGIMDGKKEVEGKLIDMSDLILLCRIKNI